MAQVTIWKVQNTLKISSNIKIDKHFNVYYYENQKHFIYSAVFMQLLIECTSKNGEMENL